LIVRCTVVDVEQPEGTRLHREGLIPAVLSDRGGVKRMEAIVPGSRRALSFVIEERDR
jgi:hypothetical protein